MQAAERTLIPYRLRAVRVGIQCTILVVAVLLVFRLLPGSEGVSWPALLTFCSIALVGTAAAVVLPWQRLFEGPWGLRLMYAWSVADIVLISVALGVVGMDNPSLFLLYTFTTIFFAASYPARSQIVLYALTAVAYLTVIWFTGWDESPAETLFKLGSLGVIAFVASFMSHELMQQMTQVTEGRIETEDEKVFYESLVQAQSDLEEAVAIVDITTNRLQFVNEAMCRMVAYSREELLAMSNLDLFPPEDREYIEGLRRERQHDQRPAEYHQDFRLQRKDGSVITVEMVSKQLDEGRVVTLMRDVTEARRAERSETERSHLLLAISELTSDYAYSVEVQADGTLAWEWVTDAFERVTGYQPDEVLYDEGWPILFHPDDMATAADAFAGLLASPGASVVTSIRIVKKSGEVRGIRLRARAIWDEGIGRAVRIFGSVEDITDARHAEAALKASEERYRILFDRLPIGLFLRTPDGVGLDANPACVRMFGYPDKETFLTTNARDFYVEEQDRLDWLARLDTEGLSPQVIEFRRWDGSTFWARVTARSIRVEDGTVAFIEGAIENISHEKEMQQEREQSLSLLRAALESTWEGLLVVDLDGHIVTFNERFIEMWSVPRKILDSRDDDKALAAVLSKLKDPDDFLERVKYLYGKPEEVSFDTIEFSDGRVFERSSIPQRIDERIVGRVWSFRDMTDRHRLEQQLLQAQKMEAVGRLAGGIAHDFNNLLTAMLGYCELVLTAPETPETTREDVKEIEQAAQMGADIAAQLLDLSRRRVLRPEVLDMNEIVRSMEPMLKRLSGHGTKLETRLSDDACTIEADRSQIEQIILNLVVNARDAVSDGGEISITTKGIEISDELASKSLRLSPGRHVLLNVSDTGHGIDPEIKDHIFEPFFTTRSGTRGTGLGLSTVYGIVTHNKGHIAVESEAGRGSSFRIYLPESIREPIPMARARAASKWLSGTETVLLVEDDDGVRRIARRALEKYGYQIIEASSGGEAVRLVLASDRIIDVLITDVIMPGMDGRQLVEKLRPERPDLSVLYMSGYTGEALARFGDLGPNEDFIAKPFRPDELIAKARDLLNRRAKRSAG
ncbi:MAG TPA: PAS domain S-box protein [Actinomycetota bacterium]|nr:PAS domain S-box protein [Actinomycetota bacterium]